jgi:hypothetical protein
MFSPLTRTQAKTLDAHPLGTGAAGDRQAWRWHGRARPHPAALPSNHVAREKSEHARHAPVCVSPSLAQRRPENPWCGTADAISLANGQWCTARLSLPKLRRAQACAAHPGLISSGCWLRAMRLKPPKLRNSLSIWGLSMPWLGQPSRVFWKPENAQLQTLTCWRLCLGVVAEERSWPRPGQDVLSQCMSWGCTLNYLLSKLKSCPRNGLTELHAACSPGLANRTNRTVLSTTVDIDCFTST